MLSRCKVIAFAILLAAMPGLAAAAIPTALTDTIKKGSGSIDILLDTSAADLAYYLSSGTMYLGVDLNEEAAGIESANSSGVAIKEMTLLLQTTEDSFTFSEFYTNTSAMIVEAGSAAAADFYTLFGTTGSNEITGSSGFDLSSFDDVIQLNNISINGEILSATLTVSFVTTDQSGANENFFDYSAGFEQFAIVSSGDATALDSAAIGINSETPIDISYSLSAPTGTPEPYWFLFLAIVALLVLRNRQAGNQFIHAGE